MSDFEILKIFDVVPNVPLKLRWSLQGRCEENSAQIYIILPKASLMASQQSVKLCWILHCSTNTLLGLAGQISEFCGPDKKLLGLFSNFRVYIFIEG